MKIEIADRAFSHAFGHKALIPGSSWYVVCFPTMFEVCSLVSSEKKCYFFSLHGPCKGFTVEQDIARSSVRIFGHFLEGYVRFSFIKSASEVLFMVEKAPLEELAYGTAPGIYTGKWRVKQIGFRLSDSLSPVSSERLYLGCHKQKEWEKIRQRESLTELLPFWFRLGQMMPTREERLSSPTLAFLRSIDPASLDVEQLLWNAYRVGFSGGMVPRGQDEEFQGIISALPQEVLSAFSLLSEGAALIRKLFFYQEQEESYILPHLPRSLLSGKMLGIQLSGGVLSFEWRKAKIRQVQVLATQDMVFIPKLPPSYLSCRLCIENSDRRSWMAGEVCSLREGQVLFLDRFNCA